MPYNFINIVLYVRCECTDLVSTKSGLYSLRILGVAVFMANLQKTLVLYIGGQQGGIPHLEVGEDNLHSFPIYVGHLSKWNASERLIRNIDVFQRNKVEDLGK